MTPDDQPTGPGDEPAAPPPPPPPPPSPGPAGPIPPPQNAPAFPAAAYGQATAAGPGTNGKAIAALILGIGGFIVCPLICSVLAIVFGNLAKKEIDANPGQEGRGMAQAGFILGIVGVSLVGLLVVVSLIAGAASN